MDITEFKREFFVVSCDMQKILHDVASPVCQRHGLTLQQMHVLMELAGLPGQTSSQLSERAGILRTNFSGLCRKLEERGLIERRRNEHDRRSYELRVTDEGRALLARVDDDFKNVYGNAFESEPQETFDTILDGLKALSALATKLGH